MFFVLLGLGRNYLIGLNLVYYNSATNSDVADTDGVWRFKYEYKYNVVIGFFFLVHS